jgi:hypothetical protein
MFDKKVYLERRRILKNKISSGIILFSGNELSSVNYNRYILIDSDRQYFFILFWGLTYLLYQR